jgi:ABC-type branched-subunit amino acid transport system ATPase component
VLEVEGLTAGYGDLTMLSGVSLRVADNESIAIVGANGAGKTTLVRTICGLVPTRQGRILKNGQPIHTLAAHQRADAGIAVVLENRNLFGELSILGNLKLAAARGRSRQSPRVTFSLHDVFELFAFMRERRDTAVELLSGGEQQMVAIARALLLNPDILILDEPSTGLAPKVVKEILSVLSALRGRGLSLLLVEQNVAIASQSSDRAYVLSLGRVVNEVERGGWTAFMQTDSLARAYLGAQPQAPRSGQAAPP